MTVQHFLNYSAVHWSLDYVVRVCIIGLWDLVILLYMYSRVQRYNILTIVRYNTFQRTSNTNRFNRVQRYNHVTSRSKIRMDLRIQWYKQVQLFLFLANLTTTSYINKRNSSKPSMYVCVCTHVTIYSKSLISNFILCCLQKETLGWRTAFYLKTYCRFHYNKESLMITTLRMEFLFVPPVYSNSAISSSLTHSLCTRFLPHYIGLV